MKKHFSPLFSFSIVFFSLLMLHSCQSDETEMGMQSKIELLKSKSAEFAKKYGVDVTLNDDSIAKYADKMTVESMEADYKAFAEMKNMRSTQDAVTQVPMKSLSKKSFIRRRKVETETITPDMSNKEGTISSGGTLSKNCCGSFIAYQANANWKSDNGTIKAKLGKVTFDCHGLVCGEVDDDKVQCENCVATYDGGPWINVPSGLLTNEGAYFSISCTIPSIKLCMYTLSNVSVEISSSGQAGRVKINL